MSVPIQSEDNQGLKPVGPRAFYEQAHPELFSDSKVTYEVPLTRELFDVQMELLSTKKMETEFENFAVAVARKLLTPNIKPQTGPDGGGDGKVDAETYRVSQDVSDKWFSEEIGATGTEKWAFAISCKKQWRSKVESDVQKCVDTRRGYTRILFFSNQYIKASTRLDVEKQLSERHGVQVEIFDRSCFVSAVFESGCMDIALDNLGFSDEYKKRSETIGPNDLQRRERLKTVEEAVAWPVTGLDTKYVDLLKESCILCRGLERPRQEIEGRFRRALDECERHGTEQQRFNIIYDHGWTCHFWFEDCETAFQDYLKLREYVSDNCSVYRLERVLNLLSVLRTAAVTGFFDMARISPEIAFFNELETILAADPNRKSCHLYLQLRKAQDALTLHLIKNQPISGDLENLRSLCDKASGNLEISFEAIYNIVEMLSDRIGDNAEFEQFVDELSDRIADQRSEVEAAKVRLIRGAKHFKANRWKDAIRHLSFCVYAFEKEEYIRELIESSALMGLALWELKLPFSAESFLVKATAFLLKDIHSSGNIPHPLVKTLDQLCEIEILLGRLVMYLNWHELLMVMARNAQVDETPEFINRRNLEDAVWAARFAASDLTDSVFSRLPDILARQGLWFCSEYLKHALGHKEAVNPAFYKIVNLDDDDRVLLDQPVFKQFLCGLNISQNGLAHLETTVNSFTFQVEYPNDCNAQQIAETILASMEALMATYDDLDLLVLHSSIFICIVFSDEPTELKALNEVDRYEFRINKNTFAPEQFWKSLVSFIAYVFSRNAIINNGDIAELLERKQNGEGMMDRVSVLQHTSMAMGLIFGQSFKCKIEDWLKDSDTTYPYKGAPRSRRAIEYKNDVQNRSTTVLLNKDMAVWDAAGWKGCGVYADRSIPLVFGLMFSNEEKGRSIFEEWKRTFHETEPPIRIVILKGINANHPFWYRVCIMPDVSMRLKTDNENRLLGFCTRNNTMEPTTNTNLEFLERVFSMRRHCRLAPMFLDSCGQLKMPIDLSLSFDFSKLTIMEAWKVDATPEYMCALSPEDTPFIPEDRKHDAPVLKALEQIRSFTRARDNDANERMQR